MASADSHAAQAVAHDLHEAAHVLPAQGPIEVFIHHNTLHAYQALPFHEAIARAEDELGVTGYLDEAEYRAAYAQGRIGPDDLEWALQRFAPWAAAESLPVDARDLFKAMLFGTPPAMSRDVLELLKAEGRWAAALDPLLDGSVKSNLIADTVTWLDEALRGEADSLLPFAHRLVGPRVDLLARGLMDRGASREVAEEEAVRRVLAPLSLAPERAALVKALATRGEALAAFSLWGACVELFGGADTLGVAPFDPVQKKATELVNDFLIPLCASFVDRGVARWTMPGRQAGFFAAFRTLYARSGTPVPEWLDGLSAALRASLERGETAEDVVAALPAASRVETLKALLLRLPGWGGMFQRLELFPVPELPRVRLVDFVAVRLVLEPFARAAAPRLVEGVEETRPVLVDGGVLALYAGAQRLGLSARVLNALEPAQRKGLIEVSRRFDRRARAVVWQEAYERHHAVEVVGALKAHRPQPPPPRTLQAIFCIDDREESFRRHFEEVLPSVCTYGVAGFFGVAVEFLALDDVNAAALAPLGVVPGHQVQEAPHPEDAEKAQARKERLGALARFRAGWRRATRGVAGGGLASFLTGPFALLEMAARVLAPRTTSKLEEAVRRAVVPEVRTVLTGERESEEAKSIDGRYIGFSAEEKAQRVATTLENIGLTRDFAPLVIFVAHGSSSVNNPHRSAYDCGACGGRNGGPNARLFARMANRPVVRKALRARGIDLPDSTHVLGAVHDTCTDSVDFFDEHEVPAHLKGALEEARAAFAEVCRRSAHERCRKFASAPKSLSLEAAHRHVEARAVDYGQARPELGHATNAVAVVGRRALTRGLFLDRRAFLISYDPTMDESGAVLERILAAVGPVGAGINLEYYFSRVDNERLGCGTKLPHNLTSHVGVMNGAASDLRTGLPKQMIEIHEPVRLLMVLEAENETVLSVAARQPLVKELALNAWVRIVTVSPSGKGWFALQPDGRFLPWDGPPTHLPTVHGSRAWYEGHEGYRPPAVVLPERRGARRVA
ncbi:MAG: DUF2309 domain-containing protein [Myxococcota bacterium]